MIHVFARAEIKPECLDAYVEILKDIVPKVRQEPGCVYYARRQFREGLCHHGRVLEGQGFP